ncbi:hypothetical protein [Endozoicomonas sp. SESOKO4]|nr:hypothetical protein [Endozoicomonas sp. SESOKO4]
MSVVLQRTHQKTALYRKPDGNVCSEHSVKKFPSIIIFPDQGVAVA